ncbi:MAG: polysaccharide biosynthesis protein [Ruminococcus sp.]|nr:polysaccharide biosynthesis protein [Ruminococcus sp.]
MIPDEYLEGYYVFIPFYAVFCVTVFRSFKLYRSIWRYASFSELTWVICATLITTVCHAIAITLLVQRMPVSYYLWGAVFQFILVLGVRFSYRFVLLQRKASADRAVSSEKVMLIGAGAAGQILLRDIRSSENISGTPVCLIDDNSNKWGRYIDGVPVIGGKDEILSGVEKFGITKIYLAIPSATAEEKREILSICSETGCELKQLPGVYQLVNGEISVKTMRDVTVEDLLGREPIKADMSEVFQQISGKVILVTGGGGSIGSELCRQIAGHSPKQLIIFDIYENNAYNIQLELKKKYPKLDLVTLIGSVRDNRKINDVFARYRPDIVYHAAAHKHVPLMEDSPCEAIKNNAIGTYKTAYAAMTHGCKRFVLISTDKAVNPTNIMGASKRLCEMIIQSFNEKASQGRTSELPVLGTHLDEWQESVRNTLEGSGTEFVAVRFGNVLGSNGSVIPVFRRQIEAGGPVTVTHPDIIRYFMTIPEAVSLVLLAGVYAKGGEIFVLDMGSPVKIDTLARNLIRLSGFRPDVDIKVEYTGLRPGEKLYEEKLMAEEGLKTTKNKLIHIGCPIPFDTDDFLVRLEELMTAASNNEEERIRPMVKKMVVTYHEEDQRPAITVSHSGEKAPALLT